MTTASAPIASRVSAVSLRTRPCDTLEPLAEKLMTSAREPLGGRLEGDPGAGGVLEEQVDDGAAAQRRQLLDRPVGERRASPRRCPGSAAASSRVRSRGAEQVLLHGPPSIVTASAPSCSSSRTATFSASEVGQVLADEVGADRQLAVAAVDQDREPDRLRAAEVVERVQRGADGAAGVEHVVDQHDDLAVDAAGRDLGAAAGRGPGASAGRRGTSSRRASRPAPRRPRPGRCARRAGGPGARRGSGCRAGRGRRHPCCARGSRGRCG